MRALNTASVFSYRCFFVALLLFHIPYISSSAHSKPERSPAYAFFVPLILASSAKSIFPKGDHK